MMSKLQSCMTAMACVLLWFCAQYDVSAAKVELSSEVATQLQQRSKGMTGKLKWKNIKAFGGRLRNTTSADVSKYLGDTPKLHDIHTFQFDGSEDDFALSLHNSILKIDALENRINLIFRYNDWKKKDIRKIHYYLHNHGTLVVLCKNGKEYVYSGILYYKSGDALLPRQANKSNILRITNHANRHLLFDVQQQRRAMRRSRYIAGKWCVTNSNRGISLQKRSGYVAFKDSKDDFKIRLFSYKTAGMHVYKKLRFNYNTWKGLTSISFSGMGKGVSMLVWVGKTPYKFLLSDLKKNQVVSKPRRGGILIT